MLRLRSPGGRTRGLDHHGRKELASGAVGIGLVPVSYQVPSGGGLEWAAMQEHRREHGAVVYDLDGTGLGKEKFGGGFRRNCIFAIRGMLCLIEDVRPSGRCSTHNSTCGGAVAP